MHTKQVFQIFRPRIILGLASSVAIALLCVQAVTAHAVTGNDWSPRVTERLIRLPSSYMVKAIDQDFQTSSLAGRLDEITDELSLKHRTLAELQQTIGQAEGDVAVELKHQFLAEKQQLIGLMSEQRDLQAEAVETRVRLYERLIQRMESIEAAKTISDKEVEQYRLEAQRRLNSVMDKVDLEVFGRSTMPDSKYNIEYQSKQTALNKLMAAYENHVMNKDPVLDGQEMNKRSYLQLMISDAQKDAALLDQQKDIITYMARLVALDAMALSEEVTVAATANGVIAAPKPINETVEFFLTQY